MQKTSLEKSKIKFLLLEGVHRSALQVLQSAGYSNVHAASGALEAEELKRQIADGSLAQLYDRWFMQPIPPANVKIGLPLSDATKDAWATPNDKPMEAYEVK